jgi:hypothetical protein
MVVLPEPESPVNHNVKPRSSFMRFLLSRFQSSLRT